MSAKRPSFLRDLLSQGGAALQFCCILHCFHEHILDVTICIGPSMLPTFNVEGDVVLVEFFSTKFQRLKSGDVVVAKSPTNPKQTVCKRICGMVRLSLLHLLLTLLLSSARLPILLSHSHSPFSPPCHYPTLFLALAISSFAVCVASACVPL